MKAMLLVGTLLGFLFVLAAVVSGTDEVGPTGPPPLLLVSFDGFRADYLKRFPMPNLKSLYSQGVLVEQMTNVFVTKTFPNHYSLVTGLYAESHGIMASNMYDPDTNKHFHISNNTDPSWWNEAEPLWITALDSGYKTAAMMWPGSDVLIHNRTATHYFSYNPHMTFRERVGNVTKWMKGDGKEEGVKFAALYWEQPDITGHRYGPENTTMMSQGLKEVDDDIGLLISELKMAGLWGQINVIITSDHGMTQCSPDRLIQLDKCLGPDNYTLVDLTPVAALIPKQNTTAVFNLLKNCHSHMTAYLKESIPERLHYRNNHRVQPIILVADEGWTIVQTGNVLHRLGDHGYDNSLPSMHPFLAAVGPSFRQGYRIGSIETVDIYPLMCHLLSVNGRPNNGTLSHTRCMMAGEKCWDVPLVVGLVVGVLLLLSSVTVLFRFLGRRRPQSIRDFQRLNIDDDDDDPLLE
ncbi:bis(5'-adenosyl)-triphosphatase enpp4 isoform X2 [Eucyclogobius newberryi]|uniref:bis(5'-adenosyl)-triphosphatase enpp4 isoform X2 n=1 Tax=Eucyclogobius newberryi TaxID=166745 RepID=UPI003B5C392D